MKRTVSFFFASLLVWPFQAFAQNPQAILLERAEKIFGKDVIEKIQQQEDISAITVGTKDVLTRAQFVTLVVDGLYTDANLEHCYENLVLEQHPSFELLYNDVHVGYKAAQHICVAFLTGIARGYRDGTFRPEQPITFTEAASVLSRAFGYTPYADALPQAVWYAPYVEALSSRNLIPDSVRKYGSPVTDAQAREMLLRIAFGLGDRPSVGSDALQERSALVGVR